MLEDELGEGGEGGEDGEGGEEEEVPEGEQSTKQETANGKERWVGFVLRVILSDLKMIDVYILFLCHV